MVTVFALMAAAMFPIIHLGRSWKVYWLFPYPNERQLWPSYHSPLLWDLTAILTYLTCSILFAYIALLPDLAMARDHTTGAGTPLYNALALGWRGTEREWVHHETALNVFSYRHHPGHVLGAHHRLLGLRHGPPARLAQHDLWPLLRGRRALLRAWQP